MPYDNSMRVGEGKTNDQIAEIILSRFGIAGNACTLDTKNGIKYSLGGVYVHPICRYVSQAALEVIRREHGDWVVDGQGVRMTNNPLTGLTFEHIIPVEVAYQALYELWRQGNLTHQRVIDCLRYLHVAIITKDENNILNQCRQGPNGKTLKANMPANWQWGNNMLARYNAAFPEIRENQFWVEEFLPQDAMNL